MWSLFRFFRGMFGFARAQQRGRENKDRFTRDVTTQRALGEGARQTLSMLEKEMRAAEREAKCRKS